MRSSGRTAIAEVVVDASVLAEYLLPGPRAGPAGVVLEDPSFEFLAPDLAYAEVANVFRRAMSRGLFSESLLHEKLSILLAVELVTYSSQSLIEPAEAHLKELSAYDALYVGLASSLHCGLATFDQEMAGAARAVGLRTILA